MLYKYSPEATERFNEAAKYQNTDLRKALESYLAIIRDFSHDEGVLAKAYYFAATAYALLAEDTKAEEYCEKSIEAGKNSGNIRCQTLSTIQLVVLKLNRMNDALAADYVYEALALVFQNHDEDLLHTIYTLLAQIFETVEDYETAIQYHRKGIEEFVKAFPDADTNQIPTYGSRIFCSSICCMHLNYLEEFEANYKELQRIRFEESLPVYAICVQFMRACLAHMHGEKEQTIAEFLKFMDIMQKTDDVMDTYECLIHTYDIFEQYDLLEHQKKVVDLLKYYSGKVDVWKCRSLCNQLEIRYYKQTQNKEQLFEAYDTYYTLEQEYHNANMKERKSNLLLRKQVFEDIEDTKYKINTLAALSETDMLTGIANRNGLNKYVKEMLPIAVKNKQEFGVCLLDIDKYKGYNDRYGHLQGDECLKKIAAVLKNVMKTQFCARYGGDEFICIFTGITKAEMLSYMEALKTEIAALNMEHINNEPFGIVTISQGGEIHIPKNTDEFEKFVYEADIKLYECKKLGRNTIVI